MEKVFSLCRGKGCCPELFKANNDKFYLFDDNNDSVVLTKEELIIFQEKLNSMFPWRKNE